MDENLFKQRTKQLVLRFIEMVDALVAKVPPSPVRGEISLSNSEQQPLPNQHKYKLGIQLTHDLPRVAVRVIRGKDLKGCQAR